VGYLSNKEAVARGAVGPTARASGVPYDIRKHDPYMAYDRLNFTVPVAKEGDVFARVVVRMQELKESIGIVRQALKDIPDGPIVVRCDAIPPGETIHRVEAPRGEDMHYVRIGENMRVERVRVRAPTEANIFTLPAMFDGAHVADIPLVVASIDPCISCMDRVAFVEGGKMKILTIRDLRKLRK
jgi:Ni,Fe-hydrogenase III large subunit